MLRAGLYLPDTGERLAVLDGDGREFSEEVELGRVQVRRAEPVDLSEVTKVGPFTFDQQIDLVGYHLAKDSARPMVTALLRMTAVMAVATSMPTRGLSAPLQRNDLTGPPCAQGATAPDITFMPRKIRPNPRMI